MKQRDLDFSAPAYARSEDPDTSHSAARAVEGDVATRLQRMVLDALSAHPGGLTSREIAHLCGLERDTISPRMVPLETNGWVYRSDERRICRYTGEGRASIVWKLKGGTNASPERELGGDHHPTGAIQQDVLRGSARGDELLPEDG
jgi:hypothetical protein